MKNVVMRSFFTLITNYAQIKRLKYWVFVIRTIEILRWKADEIQISYVPIHFSPALSKHRQNLPVGKVYTKIYVKISIKYSIVISAAEPTVLPFLGSRRLPWNNACVPGQPNWSSKGQSHWSSSRSLTDHRPASNRPFSRSTAQTAAGVIEKTKWRPCNHEKCGYKVFFYVNNKLCTDKKA